VATQLFASDFGDDMVSKVMDFSRHGQWQRGGRRGDGGSCSLYPGPCHLEYCSGMVVAVSKGQNFVGEDSKMFYQNDPWLKNLPYNSRLNELKLWSLEDRRKRVDLIEVYKMTQGLPAVNFNCWQLYVSVNSSFLRSHSHVFQF